MNPIELCAGMWNCGAPPVGWTVGTILLSALAIYIVGAMASWWTFFGVPVSMRRQ